MLASLHAMPRFKPTRRQTGPALPSECSSWPKARALRIICAALIEAVAAHRRYHQMIRQGVPHDRALRRAFGMSHRGMTCAREASGRGCEPFHEGTRKEEVMHDRKNTDRMTLWPSRAFKGPMEVVKADDIGVAEKLAILEGWEADERALQRAEDEGMGGGQHPHLHKVQTALAHLRKAVASRQ
jgi:hypothetical protein